jgi:cyclic pyranopterin phosphate synthase
MPEDGVVLSQNDKLLRSNEIIKIVEIFTSCGIDKIRFTGGEPLVRKGNGVYSKLLVPGVYDISFYI